MESKGNIEFKQIAISNEATRLKYVALCRMVNHGRGCGFPTVKVVNPYGTYNKFKEKGEQR